MNICELIILIVISTILLANYCKHFDLMYPPVLQSALWLVIYSIYLFDKSDLIPVSGRIDFIIVLGVVLFSLGSFFATHKLRFRPENSVHFVYSFEYNKAVSDTLFWLSFLLLPVFIYHAYEIGRGSGAESFLSGLRNSIIDEEAQEATSFLRYLVPVSLASSWSQLMIKEHTGKKLKLYISLLVALAYSFFSTARTSFFILFITWFGILMMLRRISISKGIAYFFTLMTGVFIVIGTLYGKGINGGSDLASSIETFGDLAKSYIVAPLPALDGYLNDLNEFTFGQNTFRAFIVIVNKFGTHLAMQPLRQEFVFVPMQTNVYTVYQAYLKDFYYYGLIFIQLFAGFLHGFFYKKAVSGSSFFIVIYSLSLYPLFMQFFDDQYFKAMSLWLQFSIIFAFLYYKVYLGKELTPGYGRIGMRS